MNWYNNISVCATLCIVYKKNKKIYPVYKIFLYIFCGTSKHQRTNIFLLDEWFISPCIEFSIKKKKIYSQILAKGKEEKKPHDSAYCDFNCVRFRLGYVDLPLLRIHWIEWIIDAWILWCKNTPPTRNIIYSKVFSYAVIFALYFFRMGSIYI